MINIETDHDLKRSLEMIIRRRIKDADQKDGIIIQLEQGGEGDRTHAIDENLNRVLEMAKEGKPIVMTSVEGERRLANNLRWQGAIGYPNVAFCDALHLGARVADAFSAAEEQKRPKDELAIELAHFDLKQDALGVLKHDLEHVISGRRDREEWLDKARRIFGDLPFEELTIKVKETEGKYLPALFEGRDLSGVFADIEGTIIQGGQINTALLGELSRRSQEKPITIWTDGDIEQYQRVLREQGILWKILPKQIFRGATVEEAYDDLNQEDFEAKYHIKAELYHNMPPAEELREERPPII